MHQFSGLEAGNEQQKAWLKPKTQDGSIHDWVWRKKWFVWLFFVPGSRRLFLVPGSRRLFFVSVAKTLLCVCREDSSLCLAREDSSLCLAHEDSSFVFFCFLFFCFDVFLIAFQRTDFLLPSQHKPQDADFVVSVKWWKRLQIEETKTNTSKIEMCHCNSHTLPKTDIQRVQPVQWFQDPPVDRSHNQRANAVTMNLLKYDQIKAATFPTTATNMTNSQQWMVPWFKQALNN